ncbi:hypothetical protein E2C01_050653 [Portunus trituberculatus]|uniref:Uncharacterized protein n=1 Tax=Portunus trituberculatus TaxID=210409 RepID=A0A5B7GHK7_PORTR|nr:hypothetical protein [Portunus trituberculatus]
MAVCWSSSQPFHCRKSSELILTNLWTKTTHTSHTRTARPQLGLHPTSTCYRGTMGGAWDSIDSDRILAIKGDPGSPGPPGAPGPSGKDGLPATMPPCCFPPTQQPAHSDLIPRVTRDTRVSEGSPQSTAKKFLPESLRDLLDRLVSGSALLQRLERWSCHEVF